jgi:hypothetical protein
MRSAPHALKYCLSIAVSALGVTLDSAQAASEDQFKNQILPLLEDSCFDCHGEGKKKGGFALDQFSSLETHLKDTTHWFAIWKNLQTQIMPPPEKPPLGPDKRKQLLQWIEKAVFRLDPKNPDPGRVTVRRLNREEYRNTVRDLLGVEYNTHEQFPADDTGYGFDTIGDVLSISPLLTEKYLEAAKTIVDSLDFAGRIPTATLPGTQILGPNKSGNARWIPFTKEYRATAEHRVERAGRYRVKVKMGLHWAPDPSDNTAQATLYFQGKELATQALSWGKQRQWELQAEVDFPEGPHAFEIVVSPGKPPSEKQKPLALDVSQMDFQGPMDGSVLEYSAQYSRVFVDGPPPSDPDARTRYRKKILTRLATQAFRRPVDAATLGRLLRVAEAGERNDAGRFESGIAHALCAILVSPRFLFRAEIQPEPNNPGKAVPVDEFALASRLSYFFWSSLPDEELLRLAGEGKLRKNLRPQVDRMLADGRSQRFVSNFVGQWLQTRDVANLNLDVFRVLGEQKGAQFHKPRSAMKDETELFFAHVLRENRPAVELLKADYTFLNEALAEFYGVPGVKGPEMRKVELPADSPRKAGVLTHGSVLLVTSNPTRTSPVKRGLFILENLLGSPAPPAPPNVPDLEKTRKKANAAAPIRELMEIHRKEPLCASCHSRMDPLGLALETFNAAGGFRPQENGHPIQTAGRLITGENFGDANQLAQVLATDRREDFHRCLAEKLLTYALGRGLEYYDTVTVNRMLAGFKNEQSTLRALIYQVIESAPFQKRRGDGAPLVAAKKP